MIIIIIIIIIIVIIIIIIFYLILSRSRSMQNLEVRTLKLTEITRVALTPIRVGGVSSGSLRQRLSALGRACFLP